MPPRNRTKPEIIEAADLAPAGQGAFSEQMWAGLSLLKDSGLSPATALNLLKTLIVESAYADKTEIEKLKLMDKLLNTARALMETSIKHLTFRAGARQFLINYSRLLRQKSYSRAFILYVDPLLFYFDADLVC